jgi:hypothetical protein
VEQNTLKLAELSEAKLVDKVETIGERLSKKNDTVPFRSNTLS